MERLRIAIDSEVPINCKAVSVRASSVEVAFARQGQTLDL
jgi:hypothetical protein